MSFFYLNSSQNIVMSQVSLQQRVEKLEYILQKVVTSLIECEKFDMCYGYVLGHILSPEKYPLIYNEGEIVIDSNDAKTRQLILRIPMTKEDEEVKIESLDDKML